MTYTLWSRGRLVGETELDYTRWMRKHRAGDFYPTEFGDTLMPIATGAVSAAMELARAAHHVAADLGASADEFKNPGEVVRRTATEYADFAAACARRDALELQLRRPDGSIVPTQWIDIRDTEYLQSLVWGDELGLDDHSFIVPTEAERALEDAIEADIALLEESGILDRGDSLDGDAWIDGDEPTGETFPRYQIQLELLDAAMP